MNASARGRRIAARLLLASLFAGFVATVWWFQIRSGVAPLTSGGLSSLHFAEPVELTMGDRTFAVSRFALNLDRLTLTLERDEPTFNDYGDATRMGGEEPLVLPVSLQREWFSNRFEVIPPRRFDQRLRFVLFPGNPNHFRLILLAAKRSPRIIDLRPPDVIPDEFSDRPQGDHFRFQTMSYGRERSNGNRVELSGTLSKEGRLSIDPNHHSISDNGDDGGGTELGWAPAAVTFKPLGPDPEGRGRRAFELIGDPSRLHAPRLESTSQHILVLGPTELSEHRLIVRKGGRTTEIMRLIDRERNRFRLGTSRPT